MEAAPKPWILVPEYAPKLCFRVCIVAVLLEVAASHFGINRGTTITIMTPVSIAFVSVCAVAMAVFAFAAYFGLSDEDLEKLGSLSIKRDRPVFWKLRGVLCVCLASLVGGWVASSACATAAQHIDGVRAEIEASVVDVQRISTPRTPCRVRISFERGGEVNKFCAEQGLAPNVAPRSVQLGDVISIETTRSFLGTAVTRVIAVSAASRVPTS